MPKRSLSTQGSITGAPPTPLVPDHIPRAASDQQPAQEPADAASQRGRKRRATGSKSSPTPAAPETATAPTPPPAAAAAAAPKQTASRKHSNKQQAAPAEVAAPQSQQSQQQASAASPQATKVIDTDFTGLPLLFSLGPLVEGRLLHRPSKTCKTPYVADVELLTSSASETQLTMAHAPSLDCAGMVVPSARLYLSPNAAKPEGAQQTRTTHAIQVVEDMRDDQGTAVLVGYHPSLAERVTREALKQGLLDSQLGPHTRVLAQQTFGSTRVDFVLEHADGSRTLLEIKNVVCADFKEGAVPTGRPKAGVYTSSPEADGSWEPKALFPHGTSKPGIKVVSDRAIKHVHELTEIQCTGKVPEDKGDKAEQDEAPEAAEEEEEQEVDKGKKKKTKAGKAAQGGVSKGGGAGPSGPLRSAVLFVVNRRDCTTFRPCHESDELFANIVKKAQLSGVKVLAHDVAIDPDTGNVYWGRSLPVRYSERVTGHVDTDRLQQVLEFHRTDPRKNWKKSSKQQG